MMFIFFSLTHAHTVNRYTNNQRTTTWAWTKIWHHFRAVSTTSENVSRQNNHIRVKTDMFRRTSLATPRGRNKVCCESIRPQWNKRNALFLVAGASDYNWNPTMLVIVICNHVFMYISAMTQYFTAGCYKASTVRLNVNAAYWQRPHRATVSDLFQMLEERCIFKYRAIVFKWKGVKTWKNQTDKTAGSATGESWYAAASYSANSLETRVSQWHFICFTCF